VLDSSDARMTDQKTPIARWDRKVAMDPNATVPADIQALRHSGLDDRRIFAITGFVAQPGACTDARGRREPTGNGW
jgi:hypothetical protein